MGTKKVIVREGGLVIVFLSAKGGTGTSSLCANYAMAFSHNKPEAGCVVVDLVLPIGSIAPIVGYEGDIDIVSVAELPALKTNAEYFQRELPRMQNWQFQLLPGAPNPERANSLQISRVSGILEELKTAFDYVVIDLGRSLSRISLPIIQKADMLVLIMGTDQSTITLTKKTWDYLKAHDIDAQNVYVIINRAVGLEGLTKAEAEEILALPINTAIPYMGSNFVLANNLHQPLIEKYPGDSASIAIKETAAELVSLAESIRKKNKPRISPAEA
jgi:pilus assembly protein CpaE